MSQAFHLDLFLEHLRRVEESTQSYRGMPDDTARRGEVNRAYNGILDASDALASYRALVARELLLADGRRRDVLERVLADKEALQCEDESDPFRPFWTKPWMFLQNVGLFPFRFASWLGRVKIRRDKDLLEKIAQHKALKLDLAEAKKRGLRPERLKGLEDQVARSRSAIEELSTHESTKRFATMENLVDWSIREREPPPPPPDAKDAPRADEIFARTRQVIARIRQLRESREENERHIHGLVDFLNDLPRAAYADVLLKERATLYQHILISVDHLVEELQLCRTLTATLDRARQRMESLFPFVSEKALSAWIHDPESKDLLAAVRRMLALLATLTGRSVAPNFEIEPPGRTLPGLLAGVSRVERSRSVRLRQWEERGGPLDSSEFEPLVDVPMKLVERIGEIRGLVVASFDETSSLFATIRSHFGTVSYRLANPVMVYRNQLDNARYDRLFLSGAVNRFFAWTIGGVWYRTIAAALALWSILRSAVRWVGYLTTRGKARQLRAQAEKILREFAEELEEMAGGVLLPGEARADHLLPGSGDGEPGPAPTARERPGVQDDVVELLRLFHELYVSNLTFGSTFLFDATMSKALMGALEEQERAILSQLRRIRLAFDRMEESLRREAEFYRRATSVYDAACASGDADRRRLSLGLVRLRERLIEAALDPARLGGILELAASPDPGPAKKGWGRTRKVADAKTLAELVWRTIGYFDSRAAVSPEIAKKVEVALAALSTGEIPELQRTTSSSS